MGMFGDEEPKSTTQAAWSVQPVSRRITTRRWIESELQLLVKSDKDGEVDIMDLAETILFYSPILPVTRYRFTRIPRLQQMLARVFPDVTFRGATPYAKTMKEDTLMITAYGVTWSADGRFRLKQTRAHNKRTQLYLLSIDRMTGAF